MPKKKTSFRTELELKVRVLFERTRTIEIKKFCVKPNIELELLRKKKSSRTEKRNYREKIFSVRTDTRTVLIN